MLRITILPSKIRFKKYLNKKGGLTKKGIESKNYGDYLWKLDMIKFDKLYAEWEKEEWKNIQEKRIKEN